MGCPSGKISYPTAPAATKVADRMSRRSGKARVYRCLQCFEWHLSGTTDRIKRRKKYARQSYQPE